MHTMRQRWKSRWAGHSGESDPLDEQEFLVNTINFIQQSKFWDSTAIIVTYDDSDGWYDHQFGPIVNSSNGIADFLNDKGVCGDQKAANEMMRPYEILLD